MSELTLTLIKLGFLAVLWIFVLSAVSVIRTDIFGTKVPKPPAARSASTPKKRVTPPAAAPRKPRKSQRGTPQTLYIVSGPNAGQSVPLGDEPILLGRGTDAAIRLNDDYVSTRHARFSTNGQEWFVDDVGSTNGTFIGSQRITNPVPITLGTQVRLGKTIVELRK
ncbi:MAG: FHA domain-containing protein [Aeromicrobium sp.]|uniref:FHA domain-containing protein FhaB/FipA n=1 Tax=Aeromicrobium sp. TaxID=1871063 RepID=UPI0039E2EC9D